MAFRYGQNLQNNLKEKLFFKNDGCFLHTHRCRKIKIYVEY